MVRLVPLGRRIWKFRRKTKRQLPAWRKNCNWRIVRNRWFWILSTNIFRRIFRIQFVREEHREKRISLIISSLKTARVIVHIMLRRRHCCFVITEFRHAMWKGMRLITTRLQWENLLRMPNIRIIMMDIQSWEKPRLLKSM